MRRYVSQDNSNQYIIFTYTTEGFVSCRNSIADLVVKKGKGLLEYLV